MTARIAERLAKANRLKRSPYPRSAVRGKHVNKQGFPNTRGMKG